MKTLKAFIIRLWKNSTIASSLFHVRMSCDYSLRRSEGVRVLKSERIHSVMSKSLFVENAIKECVISTPEDQSLDSIEGQEKATPFR